MKDKNYLDVYREMFEVFKEVPNKEYNVKMLNQLNVVYGDCGQQVYNEIYSFFERVDNNYNEIKLYKKTGISADIWLKEKLQGFEKSSPGIIEGVFTSFHKTYFEEEQLSENNLNVKNPFDMKIISKKVFNLVKYGTNIDILVTDEALSNSLKDETETVAKPIKIIKEAFDLPMGDTQDNRVKEILTIGTLKVQKKIPFKFIQDLETVQVASIVDTVYTTTKLGYKIMNGKMEIRDAVDYLVDRATARVEAVVHKTCVKYGTKAGAKVGGIVGGIFGPAGVAVGTVVGGAIGSLVGKTVAKSVAGGIQKIASVAKQKLENFGSKVSNATSNLVSSVKNLFGW